MNEGEPGQGMAFSDMGELEHALQTGVITVHTKIKGRVNTFDDEGQLRHQDRRDDAGPHDDRPAAAQGQGGAVRGRSTSF